MGMVIAFPGVDLTAIAEQPDPRAQSLFVCEHMGKATEAADSFGHAQSELSRVVDLTTGKLKTHNQVLLETVRLTAEAAKLAAEAAEKTDTKALGSAADSGLFGGRSYGTRGVQGQTVHNDALARIAQQFLSGGGLEDALKAVDSLSGAQLAGFDPIKFKEAILKVGQDRNDQKAQQDVLAVLGGKPIPDEMKPYERPKKPRADHSADRDQAYQRELGQAQDAYAKAQEALSTTAEDRLTIELDQLRAAKVQRDLEIGPGERLQPHSRPAHYVRTSCAHCQWDVRNIL